jgi:anti-sigma regulatory factor (Ser/Thr protein kinase)/putative methionine-R-sulfoxide reductase with GAF domain
MTEPDVEASTDSVPSQRLAEVDEVVDASLGYLGVEEMLLELLERISRIVEADTAAILLLDRDRGVLVARAARGIEEEVRQGVQVPVGRGFAGRIASERRPIAIEDVDHAEISNPLLRHRGIASLLGVPLMVQGEVIGVLHVGTLQRRRFDERDSRLLQLTADRAALAINNAQLTEQRSMTQLMQRVLLPDALPDVPGVRLSAKYRPGDIGMNVGGDWYDVFLVAGARVAMVIGDVVGRGLAAAASMAELRAATRAFALERQDPAEVMTRLNELVRSLGRGPTATVAILTLDLETERLLGCWAGHLPAALREADASVRLMPEQSGPPIGAMSAPQYESFADRLPPGASLLLFTDGLVERRGDAIESGLDRLCAIVHDSAGDELPLADAVFARDPPSNDAEDDIALLGVEMLPVRDALEVRLENSPAVLPLLRRGIAHWLTRQGVEQIDRYDVTLAASEAAANAITHAYAAREAGLELECRRDGEEIVVSVRDNGAWRPRSSHSGIGLEVMERLMDSVDLHRGPDGTTVVLRKRVGATP